MRKVESMRVADVEEKTGKLGVYLELLLSLASELERAMEAIARNSLSEFTDSVANQEALSGQLVALGRAAGEQVRDDSMSTAVHIDADLAQQIRQASTSLQSLNRQYAALLQHSGHSIELMVSLLSSFKGQLQEASGARLKHQTRSCQM